MSKNLFGTGNSRGRMLPVQPTVSIVLLLLHELPRQDAQLLLQRLAQVSDRFLIADLALPPPPDCTSVAGA